MAFDENIKKRNLLVLFKFNGELNVLVPAIAIAIEIRKELNSGVLINVKQGESVIDISKPDVWTCTIIHDPFFFEITHKYIGQNRGTIDRCFEVKLEFYRSTGFLKGGKPDNLQKNLSTKTNQLQPSLHLNLENEYVLFLLPILFVCLSLSSFLFKKNNKKTTLDHRRDENQELTRSTYDWVWESTPGHTGEKQS